MRRSWLLAFALAVAGCNSSPRFALNTLCTFCQSDSDCGGNPCFQDVSGQFFCGHPCGSCPDGYSCQPVTGTSGKLVQTCFPDSESCLATISETPNDLAGVDQAQPVGPSQEVPPIIVAGPVGPAGGTVDKLLFGFTGDTRPDRCGSAYPTAIINNIFTQMQGKGVQFALDQGDHMFSCGSGTSGLDEARTQMRQYVAAAALLGKTVFMTMGNHECSGEATVLCKLNDNGFNSNYTAYMEALSSTASKPYYRFDVMTKSGLAVFIMIADDVWDAAEQSWLTAQLTDADQHAKYTFVSKHHPDGSMEHVEFQTIYNLVTAHKFTLFFTGHSHFYRRERGNSRVLVMGCGGAPLSTPTGTFWGYGVAQQGDDDRITVTVYDQMTGLARDNFVVTPQ